MADLFKNIAGLGIAAYMGQSRRKSDFDRTNQLRLKNGLPPLPWEDAPVDKAVNWIGDKFKSWTTPDAAKAPAASEAPSAPVVGGSEDVGLWERLKAGNIDQEGSEAYKRWGKGKAEGEQRVAELDESSRLEATKDYSDAPVKLPDSFTKEQFSQAPDLAAEPMKMDRFEDINTPF
jgi:hypothetical protein